MNEKFGVTLELVVNKFKEKMDSVKNNIKALSDTARKGIVLETDETSSLESIKELQTRLNNLSEENKIAISAELDLPFKDLKKEVDDSIKEIERLNNLLQLEKKGIITPKFDSKGINETQKRLDDIYSGIMIIQDAYNKLDNTSMIDLNEELTEVNKNNKKIENSSSNLSTKISKSFDNSINKVKKFALSLLSVRSIYSILSRASSQYLSQDTETSNKLQAAWIGLGSVFAPLLEKIANFAIKAVSYINVFIKALTGVDLLARATTKSMNNLNKASKATSKTLAGIDEITNINVDTSVGNIDTSWVDAFQNVELNPKIVKFLEDLADKCKFIGNWVKDNKELVIGFLAALGGAYVLSKVKGLLGVLGKAGGSIGLIGSLTSLVGIAAAGITIGIICKIKSERDELDKEMEQLRNKSLEVNAKFAVENADDMEALMGNLEHFSKEINSQTQSANFWMHGLLGYSMDVFHVGQNELENVKQMILNTGEYLGQLQENKTKLEENNDELLNYVGMIGNIVTSHDQAVALLEQEGKNTSEVAVIAGNYKKELALTVAQLLEQGVSYDKIKSKIEEVNLKAGITTEKTDATLQTILNTARVTDNDLSNSFETAADKIKKAYDLTEDLDEKICKITDSDYESTINLKTDTSQAKNKLKGFFAALGAPTLGLIMPDTSYNSLMSKIASLDTGTNYVPSDQLAMIHKGEAVIPKKFNSNEYFNSDNSRVEELLETLIDRFDDIDFNPHIAIDEIGQATVDYANRKKRAQGRSVI